jgi:phenylpyruvate tautomerase PptA (4-oxalocrotonate tautomerase family)
LLRQRELAELKKEIIKEITNSIDFTANVDKTLDEILKKFFGGK